MSPTRPFLPQCDLSVWMFNKLVMLSNCLKYFTINCKKHIKIIERNYSAAYAFFSLSSLPSRTPTANTHTLTAERALWWRWRAEIQCCLIPGESSHYCMAVFRSRKVTYTHTKDTQTLHPPRRCLKSKQSELHTNTHSLEGEAT